VFSENLLSPKPQKTTAKTLSISVIVCAKMKKRKMLLTMMLAEQNYPNFEIVLIDDASSDSTLDIFEDFENYTQYPFGKSQK
jgi:glycosyltransferase involved in cell wall biosynthesis